ncbi:MAG TPA: zinc ribbon domain-containing protein [Phycisphaerae bacterium]|nr:zinc ribbon domain-containing protein [Phycisphaerae bacterium]
MPGNAANPHVAGCIVCGAHNPPMARFCHRCGAPQTGVSLRSATRLTPLLQQWRLLKADLTRREVRRILGEPLRVVPARGANADVPECWTYVYEPVGKDATVGSVSGEVRFAADGRLVGWSEPDWTRVGEAGFTGENGESGET